MLEAKLPQRQAQDCFTRLIVQLVVGGKLISDAIRYITADRQFHDYRLHVEVTGLLLRLRQLNCQIKIDLNLKTLIQNEILDLQNRIEQLRAKNLQALQGQSKQTQQLERFQRRFVVL